MHSFKYARTHKTLYSEHSPQMQSHLGAVAKQIQFGQFAVAKAVISHPFFMTSMTRNRKPAMGKVLFGRESPITQRSIMFRGPL